LEWVPLLNARFETPAQAAARRGLKGGPGGSSHRSGGGGGGGGGGGSSPPGSASASSGGGSEDEASFLQQGLRQAGSAALSAVDAAQLAAGAAVDSAACMLSLATFGDLEVVVLLETTVPSTAPSTGSELTVAGTKFFV
jgi:hypothetical protein